MPRDSRRDGVNQIGMEWSAIRFFFFFCYFGLRVLGFLCAFLGEDNLVICFHVPPPKRNFFGELFIDAAHSHTRQNIFNIFIYKLMSCWQPISLDYILRRALLKHFLRLILNKQNLVFIYLLNISALSLSFQALALPCVWVIFLKISRNSFSERFSWRERDECWLPTVPPNFPLKFSGLPPGNNVACCRLVDMLLLGMRRGNVAAFPGIFIHNENWRRHYCTLHVAATPPWPLHPVKVSACLFIRQPNVVRRTIKFYTLYNDHNDPVCVCGIEERRDTRIYTTHAHRKCSTKLEWGGVK